jgi:hypothetical protein
VATKETNQKQPKKMNKTMRSVTIKKKQKE